MGGQGRGRHHPQHARLDDGTHAVAQVERAVVEARGSRRGGRARASTGRPTASSASRRTTSRASARGSAASVCDGDVVAARRARCRRRRRARRPRRAAAAPCGRRCAARPGGCARAPGSARALTRLRAKASDVVRGVLAPGQAALPGCAARSPRARRSSSGRISRPSFARHPEQRPAARARGQAVEDGLGLVGRGVAGREVGPPRSTASCAPDAEPDVARPRLEVPGPSGRRARWTLSATPSCSHSSSQCASSAAGGRRAARS